MRPLNARQRLFAERTLAYAGYDYHTDAYLSVYGKPGMKRRNATINAARVLARPQVKEYLAQIRAESVRLAAEKAERDREEFRARITRKLPKKSPTFGGNPILNRSTSHSPLGGFVRPPHSQ